MSDRDSICAANDPPLTAMAYALKLLRTGVLSIDGEGRIWRHFVLDRWGNRKAIEPRRAENASKKGYLRLSLNLPGKGKVVCVLAHRVVWTWLKGQIPDGLQINHDDLNKANNRPGNLEVTDGSGNIRHSYANGRKRPWSSAKEWRPGIAKRSEADYARLRKLRRDGMTQRAICEQEGISRTHLQRILYKKGGAQ